MRRAQGIAAWAALLILAAAAPGRAQVPSTLHFQGVLTDDDGLPVTDTLSMTFRLFADTTAPALWSVTEPEVVVTNGFYEVTLEPAGLLFDEPYFIGIQVAGAALGPKRPLASVPYALRSAKTRVTAGDGLTGTSDSAGVRIDLADLGVGEKKIANLAVTGLKIALGAVTGEKLADQAVITEKLNDGAVTAVKIAPDQIVRSVNGIRDHVVLEPGANIAITQLDSVLRFSAVVSGGVEDEDWEIAGDNMYSIPSGNVGVGTATPGMKLDVSGGDIRTTGALISTAPTGAPPLSVLSTTLVPNLNADMVDGRQASELAEAAHSHDAAAVTSGTIDYNRLPVGTTLGTIAQGKHTHDGAEVTSGTIDVDRLPVGTGADEVAGGNHTHPGGDGDWTIAGTDMYSEVSGRVGIGTSSPSAKLHVAGKAKVTGSLAVGAGSTADSDTLSFDGGGQMVEWDNAENRFELTRALVVQGPISAGDFSRQIAPVNYNHLSLGTVLAPFSGEMNSTGDLYVQYDLEVGDGAYLKSASVGRNLSIGDESPIDKDTLFFGQKIARLAWNPTISRFNFSHDVNVTGHLFADHANVGGWVYCDVASASDSVQAGKVGVNHDVSIGRMSAADNDTLHFDRDGQELVWDNDQVRFELSSNLVLAGLLAAGIGTMPVADPKTYNYFASTTVPAPAGGDMGTGGDLYVGYDLEVGQDVYYTGSLTHIVKAARAGAGESEELDLAQAKSVLGGLRPRVLRSEDTEEGKTGVEATEIGFLPSELPDLVTTPDKSGYRPLDLVAVLTKIVQQQQATIDDLQARVRALEEGRK